MEVKLATIADYAATTMPGGKLVIAGAFDGVFAPKFPVLHGRTFLAFRVHFGPTEGTDHHVRVQLVDPDGKMVVELKGPISLQEFADDFGGSAQFVMEFDALPLAAPGTYSFDVFIDDRFEQSVELYAWEIDAQGKRIPRP